MPLNYNSKERNCHYQRIILIHESLSHRKATSIVKLLIYTNSNNYYYIAMYILWCKPAQYSGTLVIKLLKVLSWNSYCNTTSQPVFVSFTTRATCPLLKLKRSVLLVMYSWLKGIYCEMNGKYSITSSTVTNDELHY